MHDANRGIVAIGNGLDPNFAFKRRISRRPIPDNGHSIRLATTSEAGPYAMVRLPGRRTVLVTSFQKAAFCRFEPVGLIRIKLKSDKLCMRFRKGNGVGTERCSLPQPRPSGGSQIPGSKVANDLPYAHSRKARRERDRTDDRESDVRWPIR